MQGFFGRLFFILKGGEPWLDDDRFEEFNNKPNENKIRIMRKTVRSNIRLATNFLLVIGTFSVAFNLAQIAKESRLKYLCNEFEYLLKTSGGVKNYKDRWDKKDQSSYNWYNKNYIKKGKQIVSFYGMKPVNKDGMGAIPICSITNNNFKNK